MLLFPSQMFAQSPISYRYSEISKNQFDSSARIQYLVTDPGIKKQVGKLTIPIAGKKPKIFIDDGE